MSYGLWFWIILGVFFILLELLMPGLIIVFLGVGALITAVLNWTGIVEAWTTSIAIWLFSSFGLMIALRGVCKRFLSGEVTKDYLDEDDSAFGMIVDVTENLFSDNNSGRVKFRGTTWSAQSIEGTIRSGEKARIVFRNNMTWIVEPISKELTDKNPE